MLTIDSDFPGGNIIVDSIDGDTVRLHQDIRTTTEWWFYWHFRVRGAAGRTIRFSFDGRDVFTAMGPCFSEDGEQWRWLGREVVVDNGFSHTFTGDGGYFSVGIPYVRRHLDAFVAKRPGIERGVLCQTEQHREAPLLRLRSKSGKHLVSLTARTHACEAMANYAMEGILDFWLSDPSPEGQRLRDEVDVMAVPFVDADGVESGDQGKLRSPHDHNRDYIDQPIYATTRALMAVFAAEKHRLRLGVDLHCPWIRGGRYEDFYVVGPPAPWDAPAMEFARVIDQCRQGEVPLPADKYLPFGVDWNKDDQAKTLSRHVCKLGAKVGVSVEVPYGLSTGVTMTADRARALGADLGRAISRFVTA